MLLATLSHFHHCCCHRQLLDLNLACVYRFCALGPSECFGPRGFTSKWLLRVIGLPSILMVIVAIYYMFDRRANGLDKARVHFKGHSFYVVFFCCE